MQEIAAHDLLGDGLEFVGATEVSKSSPSEGYKVNITQVATQPLLVGLRSLKLEDVKLTSAKIWPEPCTRRPKGKVNTGDSIGI